MTVYIRQNFKIFPCDICFQRQVDGVVSVGFAEIEPADVCIRVNKVYLSLKSIRFVILINTVMF
jgi:hypothetical protein